MKAYSSDLNQFFYKDCLFENAALTGSLLDFVKFTNTSLIGSISANVELETSSSTFEKNSHKKVSSTFDINVELRYYCRTEILK